MRLAQTEKGAIATLANACGRFEDLAQLAAQFKLCRPQMVRLSLIAKFVELQLADPKADPERPAITRLRLDIKQMCYKEMIIKARGRITCSDDDDESEKKPQDSAAAGGRRAGASSAKRKKGQSAADGSDSEDDDDFGKNVKKIAEAEMEKTMAALHLWSKGGDEEQRKTALREAFAVKYKEFATIAAKFCE
mmetsp:Transcript_11615/g.16584  ORF Transcript_11615/g.16584 Transcript_11615/m.16584 type:complete len:192 (+) Transcript_11615:1412-1987(+)